MQYILEDVERKIKQAEDNINKSTFEIGEGLYIINKEKLYKEKCYSNFVEYVECEMHMKKTQAYNYIECYRRFGTEENKEKYKDYSVSQLILLNNAPDELIDEIIPDMSVKEIKEKLKNEYKNEEKVTFEQYITKEMKRIYKYVKKKYDKNKCEIIDFISCENV